MSFNMFNIMLYYMHNLFIFHTQGYKEVCLKACAEVSVWTRLCEIDMPEAVQQALDGKER